MPTTFLSERIVSLLLALAVLPAAGRDSAPDVQRRFADRPQVPVNSVYEPHFQTPLGDMVGGSGFLVRVAGEPSPLFLTTHQFFSSASGFDRDYEPAELATLVRNVEAYSIDGAERTLTAAPGPTIPGAEATRGEAAWRDLSAFAVTGGGGPSLSLAARGPRKGQRIWLYARIDSDSDHAMLSPAIVERSSTSSLGYRFEDADLALDNARGAPMVDVKGKVVAMHVDEGLEQGHLRGTGNPVDSIRRMLARATGQGDAEVSAAPIDIN